MSWGRRGRAECAEGKAQTSELGPALGRGRAGKDCKERKGRGNRLEAAGQRVCEWRAGTAGVNTALWGWKWQIFRNTAPHSTTADQCSLPGCSINYIYVQLSEHLASTPLGLERGRMSLRLSGALAGCKPKLPVPRVEANLQV